MGRLEYGWTYVVGDSSNCCNHCSYRTNFGEGWRLVVVEYRPPRVSGLTKSGDRDTISNPKRKVKVPEKFPEWIVKCSWRATSKKIKVRAKDSEEAWDKAAKAVLRMEGGNCCMEIEVISQVINAA